MIFVVPFLLITAEFLWQILIMYPPTLEQVNIGIGNPTGLWLSRIVSLILILVSCYFASQILKKESRRWFWIIMLAVPTVSSIWMSHPIEALKIFILLPAFFLLSKRFKSYILITGLCTILLLLLNIILFNQKPAVLTILSPRTSQDEVVNRIMREADFKIHIETPTWFRRIGYNKYFITLKNFSNESLSFFDFETLFFQEIHPLGQKAFIMFFWPEIYILIIGGWYLAGKKSSSSKAILSLLFLSFIYFITTNESTELRLSLAIWPLALVVANGLGLAFRSKTKAFRVGIILLIFLSLYGWLTNYYDRFTRPLFWLDNRPPAYQFILDNLKDQDLSKYKQIVLSDALSEVKYFCTYYQVNCTNFVYKNFDLYLKPVSPNTLYIGFTGNFIGPNSDNYFSADAINKIAGSGLDILKTTHIHDNIANKYGQDLLIVRTNMQ